MQVLEQLKARGRELIFFAILFILQTFFIYGFFHDLGTSLYFLLIMMVAAVLYLILSSYMEDQRFKKLREAVNLGESVDFPLTRTEHLLYDALNTSEKKRQHVIQKNLNKWREGQEYLMIWTHQMKTPMAALSAQVQVDENPKANNYLKEIFSMEMYLEMLLGYFRLESRDTDYRFETVDLNEVVRQSLRKYAPLFIHHRVSLDFQGGLETVTTDAKWFQFILEQLLSNAAKYTEGGKVSIFWDDGLVIKDTGIGIRTEDLPRVFDMGYTGYNGRLQSKSTGIGLFLVKKIAHELNISIELNSQVDQGTTFQLKFPMEDKLTKM